MGQYRPQTYEGLDNSETLVQNASAPLSEAVEIVDERATPARGPRTLLRFNKLAILSMAGVIVLVAAGGLLVLGRSGFKKNDQLSSASGQAAVNYDVKNLALGNVSPTDQLSGVTQASKLTINGDLRVGRTLVLTPTTTPTAPVTGQLYYDSTTNTPYFYDGSAFVNLADNQTVKSIGGINGAIDIGNGLQLVGKQLSISNELQQSLGAKVTTVQGQSGNITFTGGTGISVNGTTISNTGITQIVGSNGLSVVRSDGQVSIGLPQPLDISSSPTFASAQLASALGIGSGGTNSSGSSYSQGGVFYFNGSNFSTTSAAAGNGLCLLSGPSGPYFGSCSGAAAGVSSITGSAAGSALINGDLTFSDAVTTDNGTTKLVTIQDAGAGAKGLVSTGAQTFAGLKTFNDGLIVTGTLNATTLLGNGSGVSNVNAERLNGQLAAFYLDASNINNGSLSDVRLSTNVPLKNAASNTFTGAIAAGSVTATTLAGDGNSVTNVDAALLGGQNSAYYRNAGNSNVGTLADARLSSNVALLNAITNVFAGTVTASTLNGNGGGVTNVNAVQLNGQAAGYYLNATNVTTGTLADARLSSNVALLAAATNNFTGALQRGGNDVCTVANNCNYLTGSAASGTYIQLQASTPGTAQTGNFNITGTGRAATLYQNGNQVCDRSGNCNGLGGALSGTGTAGTIAMFTGTGTTLGDSLLSQASTTVSVGGTLSATNLNGNGSGLTNVNAASLGGQLAGYYTNATNLNSGTLNDNRLSANVALLGAATSNFTGALQHNGNAVCDASNNCNYLTGASASGSYVQLQATTPGTAQTGNLNISGTVIAGNLSGNGSALTSVNAATLGGNNAAYYRNGSNINSGTVADTFLTSNVALLGAATSNFIGALQHSGNAVCDASNNCNYLTGASASGSYVQLQATTPGTAQTGNLNISGAAIAASFSGNGSALTSVNAASLAGNSSAYYLNATNLNAGTLSDLRLSTNVAQLNAATTNFTGTLQHSDNAVCDASNNCSYLTGASASGSYVQLQATTPGTAQTGNLNISGAAIAASFAGNGNALTSVNAATLGGNNAAYYRDATNLNAGTLSDLRLSANVAQLNSATTNFTGTLQHSGNAVCDASNNCNYLTGSAASGTYIQLQASDPGTAQTGHFNIAGTGRATALYQNGNQVCDTSGNCTGGSSITGSGTAGTIAVFTGTGNTLGNSLLSQATTTVTVAGTLAATDLTGNGTNVTNVNAAQLNSQAASYYLNATNLNAGILSDLRLSTNVAQLNAATTNFTGTLQHSGNAVCDASNNCNYVTGASANGSYVQLQATTPGTAQTGNLNISGTVIAGNLSGNGTNVTNVNAAQLNSQAASYYRDATNLNAGTLSDLRLSTNVAQLNAATTNFTGTLQHSGNAVCDASNNCNYLTGSAASGAYIQLQVSTPGTAQTGHFNIAGTGRATSLYQNGNQVCDTSGNCTGIGGALTGSGTAGTITMFTGTGSSVGNSILTQASTTVTVAGTLAATNLSGNGSSVTSVNAATLGGNDSTYYLNASNLSSGVLNDGRLSANVALLGAVTNNFTGTLQHGGNAVCDVSNNCNYLTSLIANDKYIQLQATDPGTAQTGNINISGTARAAVLYQNGNQVCDTSGNCNGVAGEVTGSGTAGTIPVFTGTGKSLGNSILTQASTTVTVAGTLAATNLSGNGSSVTSVNAATLGGNNGAYYQNATNLNTGTVADALLSTNVALLNGTNTFTAANTFSTSIRTPVIQSTAALSITGGTTVSVQSTGLNAATFDSGTTGNVNIGTGNNQKTITVGNSTSASTLNLVAGTGGITLGNAGVANTIQIGNTTGAVAQTIAIGSNATAASLTTITLGSTIGTSALTVQSGTSGVLVKGANSTTAFNIQNATAVNLFTVNTTNSVIGIGGAPVTTGAKLQVTGAISTTGDLTIGGRVYAGQSGVNVISGGATSASVLYGDGTNVILQNVSLATNSTVKVGTSMGVLYVDGSGNLQVLSVSGQTGNCVNYNGTTVTWSGCSGSGGGGTGWSNGGNAYTTNPGTATSRFNATYDATITNPVMGLQGANALDIITNNYSRIRVGDTGDVAILSNGSQESTAESTTKFTVRNYNAGNAEQYNNTLVVDTTATGTDYAGRVGIGLKVATAPQVTLDIGGGRNDYGGSGIQIRAGGAPSVSTSGTAGAGTASTGRIYYDETLLKFRISQNGSSWSDLLVGGGGNPFLVGGNAQNGTAAILGTTDNSALNIRQNGADRIVLDQGGNINLTAGALYSVNVAGATTQTGVALNVNGRILATQYASGGYVGADIGACNSNQTINGLRVVAGLVVSGTCATNNSDLAEAYNSSDSLVAGEIVMASGTSTTSVNRAVSNGADKLIGIVSTAPGKLLGTEQVPNGYPIALSGRVPTKVSNEGGAIAVGDKITISSVPGVGKKATGAGMVVGTAMEAFNGAGTGTIEVFVNLGYYAPSSLDMIQAQTASFGDMNVSGTATINNLKVTGLLSVHDLVVSGHIITASGKPTTELQAAAGSSASVSITGNDTTGTLTITTGATPTAGDMAKIVFSQTYTAVPHVVLSPSSGSAANARFFKGATSVDSFMLDFNDVPTANTTYTFDYFISQ